MVLNATVDLLGLLNLLGLCGWQGHHVLMVHG
jgi:hypothetical protein